MAASRCGLFGVLRFTNVVGEMRKGVVVLCNLSPRSKSFDDGGEYIVPHKREDEILSDVFSACRQRSVPLGQPSPPESADIRDATVFPTLRFRLVTRRTA